MKYLTTLLTLILFLTLNINQGFSQITYNEWETTNVTDEFGDPTGDTVDRLFVEGTFSNSATRDSDLTVKFVDYGDGLVIELYEYDRSPANLCLSDGCFGYFPIRDASGETHKIEAFAGSSTGLYVSDDRDKLLEILNNSEEVRFVIYEDKFESDYGRAVYRFTVAPK